MAQIEIEGLHKLEGTVEIHGAKNSALPQLAATLLANGVCELHRCPRLSDIAVARRILESLGCRTSWEGDVLTVDSRGMNSNCVSENLMREMRSSIVFLGAIVARTGSARMSLPGGCELGPRPIDLHLAALRSLGVVIEEKGGHIDCHVEGKLHGAKITLSFPSVGATENILLAACTAEGTTVLSNAAREPEIVDLAEFLNDCGARISDAGEGILVIEGVEQLQGCSHMVIADRIESATYIAAAAITGGSLHLTHTDSALLSSILPYYEEMGCRFRIDRRELIVDAPKQLQRVRTVRTMPYPGFPTDALAPTMAALTVADGTSVFIETIFENRYKHTEELCRLGASIKVDGRVAIVEGVRRLYGAHVECTDLRGGAALVIAGLAAEGKTTIGEIRHIDRGYEMLTESLANVGAQIQRVD